MTDYGHALEFGLFATPTSGQPQAAVELAVLAEQAGLDLVTFQDHPYQPALLDTWTLLSYAAARTRTIRLAGNVLNLPLRSPALLARSVASLDLLSGGRIELGIGAGGFWDAIAAMGARRLSPGEAVDALAEAIEIIRQTWENGVRGPVTLEGSYYQVRRAKRGPAPAHPVSIWVGAYKPRMLALTGRLADGWLPSLGYLKPGQLAAGNAAIDQAAAEAGREPQAIRRLLNISGEFGSSASGLLHGPPRDWSAQLADLALADGISTFILASDDPEAIARFAAEVAPAVRELVAAARGNSGTTSGDAREELARGTDVGDRPAAPSKGPLSAVRLWDEADRPTRLPAEVAVGYTPAGRGAGAELIGVHDYLRSELTTLRDLIDDVRKGAIDAGRARSALSQMTMRQNNWTMGAYCESYCRLVTYHHSAESAAVFPHLRAREPALGPVLDRLTQEHESIHAVLDTIDLALLEFVAKPAEPAPLQEAVDLLTDALLSHLAYEERELVEPLDRYGFY